MRFISRYPLYPAAPILLIIVGVYDFKILVLLNYPFKFSVLEDMVIALINH
jgi:hypothetical protein